MTITYTSATDREPERTRPEPRRYAIDDAPVEDDVRGWAICWRCQQPVRRGKHVMWRGEAVHRRCLLASF